ncbi:phosphoribosylaminoimidazolesuccinocarboxamide synthase [Pseudohaliea rubra]|uniref:Phosphoribosylaminoimidazole-succinocarboxamide synthase n=1 Tax=Pseudohaliea rubra DSM 19751 TaxID=1265313 RepID=A0A095VN20_9GAMM|nr:phosphoribosylaminoimidazolesuccinocarboxamide synthase [Pseudohaliea rubra]KGE02872.1 Phosphoribosylaminoimidazole-succinocarboxamide synthase [Pseudohaliea rubra DSM 19751]
MDSAAQVLAVNDDLPIRTGAPVHSGKVRAVYWLTERDSRRLAEDRGYRVVPGAPLGIMVISDRLSAFDCLWRAEGGWDGVPGKGAALNAIAAHWFRSFAAAGLAPAHLLEAPHPLLWVVQRARPLALEAIARQYITGSLWRAYEAGERSFCGIALPEGLGAHERLPELLMTPSTKGVLRGLPGVPEADDVNISRAQLLKHRAAFGFEDPGDVDHYTTLLASGFRLIERELAALDLVFVDTKFEFGYVDTAEGTAQLIYLDEVGTPDSSRIWDGPRYRAGEVVEFSKEAFRQALLSGAPDPAVLLDKGRMASRQALAREWILPRALFEQVSASYRGLAERLTGERLAVPERPREELTGVLADELGLLD